MAVAGWDVGVRVLGPVALWARKDVVAIPGVRQQALLARLLLAAGAPVGPWELRHDVWHGRQKSDAALRVAVMRLRTLLAQCGAQDAIRRTGDGYLLDRSASTSSAERSRR